VDPQILFSRVLRCILLDSQSYEEVRTDSAQTAPGIFVVILASYLAGLGGFIWTFTGAEYADHFRFFLRSFIVGGALQTLLFLLWVLVTSLALTQIFHVPARYTELVRVMSFAFAPVALQLILFIPAFDQPIGIIALGAALFVTTFAVQTSTIATPGQAFVATLLGFSVFCLILGLLGNGPSDLAPGIFALDPNSLSVGSTLQLPSLPR
jgi:hypothetical protein